MPPLAAMAATLLLMGAPAVGAPTTPAVSTDIHVTLAPANDPEAEARETRDLAAQEQMALWAKRMFQATLAQVGLGLLSVVGLGVTVYYAHATAKAGRESAKAAMDAVEDARDRAKRELRAYVGVALIEATDPVEGERIRIDITARNAGQTPAHMVRTAFNHAFGGERIPSFGVLKLGKATEMLPGGEVYTMLTTRSLEAQLLGDLQDKKRFLYCRGHISYRDDYNGEHTIETVYKSRHRPNGSLTFRVVRHKATSTTEPAADES